MYSLHSPARLVVLILIITVKLGFSIIEGTPRARIAGFANPDAHQGERVSRAKAPKEPDEAQPESVPPGGTSKGMLATGGIMPSRDGRLPIPTFSSLPHVAHLIHLPLSVQSIAAEAPVGVLAFGLQTLALGF